MTPSQYLKQYEQYKDIHSLENVLRGYCITNTTIDPENRSGYLVEGTRRQLLADPIGREIVEEFDNEVKLAKDTLAKWRAELDLIRPKTRGELKEKLLQGIACEVVADNEETTSMFLDGWLEMKGKYKTRPSQNNGWVIYEPA